MSGLVLLLGCAGLVRTVEYDRETFAAGTAPAPAAPRSVGPLPEARQFALEGSLATGLREDPVAARAGGALGGWVTRDALHSRVTWGWTDWLEGGFGVDAAHTVLAGPLATDVSPHSRAQLLARVGQQLRFAKDFGSGVRAGALFEAELGPLPAYTTETLTTTTTTWDEEANRQTQVSVDVRAQGRTVLAFTGRTGLFLGWDTPWGFSIGGGGVAQLVPVFPGHAVQRWGCRYYDNGDSDCDDTPERPPLLVYDWAVTPWLDVEVPVGAVAVVGRGWVHAAGSSLATPGGVELGIRWAPGRGE